MALKRNIYRISGRWVLTTKGGKLRFAVGRKDGKIQWKAIIGAFSFCWRY